PDVPMMPNPDGYTRWMNPTEFTFKGILGFTPGALGNSGFYPSATLNPYKYFTDGLQAYDALSDFFSDPDNISQRGLFTPGSTNFRHYKIIWPSGKITFQYAVIASYDEPDPIPPQDVPDDFPVTANCAEAFFLKISDNGSTAFYENPDSNGGDLKFNLEVFDWGVLGHGGTITDEIGEIMFESPIGLIDSPMIFDPTSLTAFPGTSVSSVYEVEIPGVTPSGIIGQTVLLKVTSAIQDTYDYGFGVPIPDAPLANYLIFDAPISDIGGELPTAVAEACTCLWIAPGGSVQFSGAQSFSPNGNIVNWEWDWQSDGTWDDTGETASHIFNQVGTFDVNLRVTDVLGKTDQLDSSEKLTVHVGSFSPPTANAYICPTIGFIDYEGDFKGSGSTGTIDMYEWDFENDCIWDYESATDGDTTHAYDAPDIYTAVLRVTGNGCDTSETDVRMIDPLGILENGNFWSGMLDPWIPGYGGVATKTITIVPNDTFKNVVYFHRCCTSDGGTTYIYQDLDCDVTGFDELYYNFFFMVDYDSLYGDGWMGGEMDMCVRLYYQDIDGNNWQAWIGWDTTFDGTWQWNTTWLPSYVTYHFQDTVPLDTWVEKKTIDLKTISPQPVKITRVLIGSYGWDWDTYCALPWFSEE
ncbi:MAG: PKD domain-containing protein, partial [bacterium]